MRRKERKSDNMILDKQGRTATAGKRFRICSALIIAVIVASLCVLMTGCSAGIKNSSFEKGSGEKIDGWSINNYERSVGDETSGSVTISENGYKGKGIKISNNIPNDVRVYQKISLKPESYYKVSCMVKIEGEIDADRTDGGRGAGFNVSAMKVYQRSTGLYTTDGEWMEYTAYVQTGKDQKDSEISIGIGGYSSESQGVAYVDEISITKIAALPEGMGAINIYIASSSSDSDNKQETSIWFKILFIALAVALAVFVILVLKKHDEEKYALKEPLSAGPVKLKKLDIILICSLTLVCAVASFIKLGDASGPSSYWKPAGYETVTVEFDEVRKVSRTTVLPNIPSSSNGTYIVKYEKTDGSGIYEEAFTFSRADKDPPEFFEWKLYNNSFTTKRVQVICQVKGLALNEMAFWEKDSDGQYIQIPVKVVETDYDKETNNTEYTPDKLFDEQELAQAWRTYENGTYFDEIYFPRTAYEHLNGLKIYETTHPPLGKTLISLGISIFGMNPFGWRFIGTLMGVLLVPIIYLLALKILKRSNFAFIAAFLLSFDFMRTAQTRLATIDTYSVFFTLLMYYFMFDYFTKRSYDMPFWKSMLPLFLCGICFGLGAASKWTSIYSGVGLAILFFISKICEAYDVRTGRTKKYTAGSWLVRNFLPTCGMCVIFFILIPIGIYVLSYLPYMPSNPDKSLIDVVIENQKYMYNYHSGLNATHPYQSSWYSWIIDLRPIYYYSSGDAGLASGMRASVASFGNPAIWWVGLGCLPAAVYFTWKRREKAMLVAFIGYACQLFPWILVTRCTFIYHYFTSVPFLIIMIAYVIKCLYEDKIIGKPTVFIYLGIVLVLYAFFYPVLIGLPVKSDYISGLRWFNTWSF